MAESAGAAAADDWLVRAAALARAAPGPNFSLLCQLVKASQARLFECSAQGARGMQRQGPLGVGETAPFG